MRATDEPVIYTIGHSNHAVERFIELLRAHAITALADVRTTPYSRRYPQFAREALAAELENAGVAYSWLGRELGGLRDDYAGVAQLPSFRAGLQRLIAGSERFRIAMMCAEREPSECHRGLLISPQLERAGASVAHVLANGSIETHAHTMDRLLDRFGLREGHLFRTRAELVEEALARQWRRILGPARTES